MDGFGRVVVLVVAGLLLFMIPFRNKAIDYQAYDKNQLEVYTKEFADRVMESGYIDIEMYEKYLSILSPSINTYEIEMVHSVKTLTVMRLDNTNTNVCDKGHYYFRKDDGSDEICPYCNDSNKEIIQPYMDKTYTKDILEKLYTSGIYYFNKGDYFTVNVRNASKGPVINLLEVFYNDTNKNYSYGGMVYGEFF